MSLEQKVLVLLEILAIFAVFAIFGADSAPAENEPYYLAKAAHFWDAGYAPSDTFLDTADSHYFFYVVFGPLTLFLPLSVVAWVGRILTWLALAAGWWRLNRAIFRRDWVSVLTAALFACALYYCHLAGEWVLGGFESKGFAYALLFFALSYLLEGKWKHVWILLGCASAIHVLVGGWAVVAAGMTWLFLGKKQRMPLRQMLLPLAIGGAISLLGLIPALLLSSGVSREIANAANEIYVHKRLAHHLLYSKTGTQAASFVLLLMLYFMQILFRKRWRVPGVRMEKDLPSPLRTLQLFVAATLVLAVVGIVLGITYYWALRRVGWAAQLNQTAPICQWLVELSTHWLRYYWFRLSDVLVPIGFATLLTATLLQIWERQRGASRVVVLVSLILLALVGTGGRLAFRARNPNPPAMMMPNFDGHWRDICWQVTQKTPRDARFLTPRLNKTFLWYTGRGEVGTWKNIPQDDEAIVTWYKKMRHIHGVHNQPGLWHNQLSKHGTLSPEQVANRLRDLGRQYDAQYVLTYVWWFDPAQGRYVTAELSGLPVVAKNHWYVLYDLQSGEKRP